MFIFTETVTETKTIEVKEYYGVVDGDDTFLTATFPTQEAAQEYIKSWIDEGESIENLTLVKITAV